MGTECGDSGGSDTETQPAVPLDALPGPAVRYVVRDGEPVLDCTNTAFESAFDGTATGTPVEEWWRDRGLDSGELSADRLRAALVAGRPIEGTVVRDPDPAHGGRDRTYRLRSDDGPGTGTDPDSSAGYLFFSPVPASEGVEVDRIASVVSHDLRNPLDVADAHLQAARERGDEEHFDRVAGALDRMERIIRDVLTLARGEEAITPSATVGVEAVAADAWTTVDTAEASLVLGDDLPTVAADPDRLQRLFENLFRNSTEHARPVDGDEELRIRVGATDDGAGFYVADNGTGIPSGERDRVFESGYTAGGADGGPGLGLAIVERIAEAHGWTVSVVPGPGGARFEFHGVEAGE